MLNDQFTANGISWGLGFGVFKKANRTYFGHSGFYFGYNSQTTFNPVDKIGVTVCVNSNDGEPYPGFPWSISDQIYEWLTEVLKSVNKNDITISLPEHSFYEGRYSNVLSDKLVIYLKGKLQVLDPYSPDPKATSWIIERITGDTFRKISAPHFAPIGELLIFKRDSTGKISGFNEGEAAKWSEKME